MFVKHGRVWNHHTGIQGPAVWKALQQVSGLQIPKPKATNLQGTPPLQLHSVQPLEERAITSSFPNWGQSKYGVTAAGGQGRTELQQWLY